MVRVKGCVVDDFNWLVDLLKSTPEDKIPRILIFFRNIDKLSDAFAYVTVKSGKTYGEVDSNIAMFHLNTLAYRKKLILADLGRKDGALKVIFCSSSLSMGMNLSNIEYVIHYGPPLTAEAFFQESGRAGREKDIRCYSILLTYSQMLSGCKPDEILKKYSKSESGCLRNILLAKFQSSKPEGQPHCCMRCDSDVDCPVLTMIDNSVESSITESYSDDSVASVGSVESL